MTFRLFVLAFENGRNGFGVWQPLGRGWWTYRDASLWRDEMRACGAGTEFEVVEEHGIDPNYIACGAAEGCRSRASYGDLCAYHAPLTARRTA
jgi:hypothetical protein